MRGSGGANMKIMTRLLCSDWLILRAKVSHILQIWVTLDAEKILENTLPLPPRQSLSPSHRHRHHLDNQQGFPALSFVGQPWSLVLCWAPALSTGRHNGPGICQVFSDIKNPFFTAMTFLRARLQNCYLINQLLLINYHSIFAIN